MAQITEAFVLDMMTACERKEHPPLTVHEAQQLLHAWREREALRKDAEGLRTVALELERLMLVIESAVRHSDPRNHAAVMALLLANKSALAAVGAA